MLNGCRTTKIFCRRNCPPGRRTKHENRVLFQNAEVAVAAGYRACRVCLPLDAYEGDWKPKRERVKKR